ncbi:hypothetical protein LCGC14_0547480 [marine sediment metagenome]|uniref:Uncharacterized protein n=1 Tax=marine sediment metagenome TaxID=412755 RepID=A0A0F9RR35_9ZZZZ
MLGILVEISECLSRKEANMYYFPRDGETLFNEAVNCKKATSLLERIFRMFKKTG